jgi:hypothetical protein
LRARALFQDEPSEENTVGEPFTLTVLAGLPVDYNYPQYADSFERQYGLEAGALADPYSDFDNDGQPNGIEYQLFWHGFDPVVIDSGLMPRLSLIDGEWGLTFLRDTYKDDLQLTGRNFSVRVGSDFENWQDWQSKSDAKPGDPVFESGIGAPAIGRIMARRLSVVEADAPTFFQFSLGD